MADLVTPRLPFPNSAAQPFEGLDEERLYVMRLKPPHLGALHLLTNLAHLTRVHRVLGQGGLLKEALDLSPVERVVYHLCQPRLDFGPLSVPDGVQQQIAQRPSFELHLA